VSAPTPSPASLSMPARPVEVAAIDRELTRLWEEAGRGEETPHPVTRACMSNLIILCHSDTEAHTVEQEIGDIVAQHPARVLLLVAREDAPSAEINAHVSAQCHLAGGGRQICSEHVTIAATNGATRGLPSVARPLLVGDVPTTLWWATAAVPQRQAALFLELADMAQQILYDSRDWGSVNDGVAGIIAVAEWAAGERPRGERQPPIVSDLAWRCLKPWRRLISQALDPAIAPGALVSIRAVEARYGGRGLPQAWLLLGWLASCLNWEPDGVTGASDVDVTWMLRAGKSRVRVTGGRNGDHDDEIRSLSITWDRAGQATTTKFEWTRPGRLTANTDAADVPMRCLTLQPRPPADVVARQLPRMEGDIRFRRALAAARQLAELRLSAR